MAVLELDIACELRPFTLELSLAVGDEVVALVGPSGAGKTTVLRAVAGLVAPSRGSIACAGETWFHAGALDVPPERRSVGYVPQHQALFPHMTVAENVAFAGADRRGVDALLSRLGIGALADERPARLSGGERQRAALARALARRPRVLLLDEPLAALDPHTRGLVRDELAAELHTLGIPTLLVTHDLGDAMALADRVAVLVDGTLRQVAPPAELVGAPADAFVVALAGGSVVDGAAVYPWDVEVRPGPGPANALGGTVRSVSVERGRLRVRVDDWVGEATDARGLEPGAIAHGIVARRHTIGGR